MVDLAEGILLTVSMAALSFLIFIVLNRVCGFIFNKLRNNSHLKNSRLFNIKEYFPEEEIFELRQIFYLAMIVIFFINMLYILISWGPETINIAYVDILISLYLASTIKRDSFKNKLLFLLLVPIGSISFIIIGAVTWVGLLDLFHAPVFLYFIKVYFKKFMDYTETNSLGITIILLFSIIFVSFIITMIVEHVSPLNSLVMVSNAFTSNGYAVLGSSGWGKINSIFLVWSGFILSGVATATLTVAIVMEHVDESFDRLEQLAKKNKKN